jgi:competence protein ComEC
LERERHRWPFWLPVALAAGIVAYFALPFEPPLSIIAVTPLLGLAAWGMRPFWWPGAIGLLVLTTISLGFSVAKIETVLDERPMLEVQLPMLPVSGRVAATDILPDGLRLTLLHPRIGDLAPEKTPEKVRVKFDDLTLDEAPPTGAEVSFPAMLSAFSEPVAPGAADLRRNAYFNHLGGLGWSRSPITITNHSPDDYTLRERFFLALERTRKTLAKHVYERLKGDTAAVTAARLNGEQTGISSPVMEAMRTAGLAHLLATSGANVTIMGLLIYFPLRMIFALIPPLALRYPIKKWAAVAAIFSALSFTFLVGSQAATMRSMVMLGLAMAAILVDRHSNPLRLVMLSALLSMIFAPSATMGASFQMSFAAVFCLVAASRGSEEEVSFRDSLPSWLVPSAELARASVIAIAAVTPFSIYHFQTFNLYGVVSNVVAIPITSFWVMPCTIMAYLTAPWGHDGLFIDLAGVGNALTIRLAKVVASWPHSVFAWPAMPDAALIAITLGGLWLCLWRERWRYAGILPVVLGMAYPLYTTQPDLFVAPSGKTWGVMLQDERLAVSNAKRDKFVLSQWQQRLGGAVVVDAKALPDDHHEIRCDDDGCVFRRASVVVAMPFKEAAALEDCGHAGIVIAPFIVTDCAAKVVIDAKALREYGAHSIAFSAEGPRVAFAHPNGYRRPWSVGWNTTRAGDEDEE